MHDSIFQLYGIVNTDCMSNEKRLKVIAVMPIEKSITAIYLLIILVEEFIFIVLDVESVGLTFLFL